MVEYRVEHGEGIYISEFTGKHLHRSMFNLNWLSQAGVDPKVIFSVGEWDFGDGVRFKEKWPKAEVYGFELLRTNYDIYSTHARQVGVKTYNYAITNSSGWVDFYESQHATGDNAQSTLLKPTQNYLNNYGGYVKHVPSTRQSWSESIEKFCYLYGIEKIDFLHEDTEGNLFNILKGFGRIRPKVIFGEFLLEDGWESMGTFAETLDLLKSMGYKELQSDLSFDKLFIHSPH